MNTEHHCEFLCVRLSARCHKYTCRCEQNVAAAGLLESEQFGGFVLLSVPRRCKPKVSWRLTALTAAAADSARHRGHGCSASAGLSAPLYSFIDRQSNLLQSAASATVFPLWWLSSSSGAAQQPLHLCGRVQCEREKSFHPALTFRAAPNKEITWLHTWRFSPRNHELWKLLFIYFL